MNKYLVDASFIICYLSPDESSEYCEEIFDGYYKGQNDLYILDLTVYEVANSIKSLFLKGRATEEQASNLLESFLKLKFIVLKPEINKALQLALKYNLSAYDASYAEVCESRMVELLTLDRKLKAVADSLV